MTGTTSYKSHYHKKRRDFHVISEIRQWIIDFWYNFIKRLKNVLTERRLSRTQSLHTKSITNVSTHFNTHIDRKKNINHMLAMQRKKSPVKIKKSRKNKRKIEKTDIFEELSDDYFALYKKKSYSHVTPKKSSSIIIDKKQSSYSIKSRRESKHSQMNKLVQEVTQKYIEDGLIEDLNWLPKIFGCILPANSTSRMNLHKIDNNQDNNHNIDDTNKLEKVNIRNEKNYKTRSKIPRYQYKHSAMIQPKPRIPYSKHHQNCINNN